MEWMWLTERLNAFRFTFAYAVRCCATELLSVLLNFSTWSQKFYLKKKKSKHRALVLGRAPVHKHSLQYLRWIQIGAPSQHTHTNTHTNRHTTNTCKFLSQIHTSVYTYSRTRTHTHTHRHTHKHTHTHTRTHTQCFQNKCNGLEVHAPSPLCYWIAVQSYGPP